MDEEARRVKEEEIDRTWEKYMKDQKIEKEQKMTELADAAEMRGGKKKRKGKGGAKKSKKKK